MSPLKRLNEEMNDAATSEADSECIVIGISEGHDTTGLFTTQDCEGFRDNRTLNATAAHGTDNFAIFVHSHCGTSTTWSRALDIDNARECDALAGCPPTVDVVEKVTHG
jgi:hypothetical protein